MIQNLDLSDISKNNDAQVGGCASGACGCGSANKDKSDANGEFVTDYLVADMTCSHCVSSVTRELSKVAGVAEVSVQLNPEGASTVTVASSRTLSPTEVAAAIEEAGYSLAE